MGRLSRSLLLFLAVFLILLGAIFIIAGGIANMSTGIMLVLIAVIILLYDWRTQAADTRPVEVTQNINIKMGAGGAMEQRQLKCKNCGAPLQDRDLKLVDGGIMATCPYCRSVTAFEEAPKW